MTADGSAEVTGAPGADLEVECTEGRLAEERSGDAAQMASSSVQDSRNSSDTRVSRENRRVKDNPYFPTFKSSSSFSLPSPAYPPRPEFNYSASSPALPYLPEDAVGSLHPGKYRPRTRSSSDGADVRWYFCKTPFGPNEKAASLPLLEVVGKSEYFRFSLSDSATLEAAFLENEEELVSAWWKEYAECRDGPASTRLSPDIAAPHDAVKTEVRKREGKRSDRSRYRSSTSFEGPYDEDQTVGVIVKGGLYEVDLRQRRCSPVYWRGDHRRVLRGHWFALRGGLDWLPVREDIAEQLEIAYENKIWRRRRFQPSGLFAARVNLHGATEGLHALFTGEEDSWEAWLCVDASRFSVALGLKTSDVRLRRGFIMPESNQPTQDEIRQRKEEELDDYASKVPVRHVVFMVHGIGQRLEKANLVDDVGTFRHTVAVLAEQHLTQYQRNAQRVLFIPCQWRRGLKLGGEQAVEDCTLEGVRTLRTMLSATVHDVLYYMSPVYCQDIIDSVSHSLNRLYRKFLKRNPNYDGKVSIYGHSLGSVLSYDILCHQKELTSVFPIVDINEQAEDNEDDGGDIPEDAGASPKQACSIESEDLDNTDDGRVNPLGAQHAELKEKSEAEEPIETEVKSADCVGGISHDSDLSESQDSVREEDSSNVNNKCSSEVETSTSGSMANSSSEYELVAAGSCGLQEDTIQETEIDNLNIEAEDIQGDEPCCDGYKANVNNPEDSRNLEGLIMEAQKRSDANDKSDDNMSEGRQIQSQNSHNVKAEVLTSTSPPGNASPVHENEIDFLRKEVERLRHQLASMTAKDTSANEPRSFPSLSVDSREALSVSEASGSDEGGDEDDVPLRVCDSDDLESSDHPVGDPKPRDNSRNLKHSAENEEINGLPSKSGSKKHFTPYISYTKLDFKVDTFYAVGSPLGVFLSLRNIRLGIGEGGDYWDDDNVEEEMPEVRQMMNIFHPFDPVAYRVEPLVCREYVDRRPPFIPYHKGGKRLHIGMQEFSEEMSARSRALVDSFSSVGMRMANAFSSGAAETKVEEEAPEEEKSYGDLMMERLTGGPGGRMDYMLQDATFEHQYISVMSSHTSYWQDMDTALFILRHLYRDIPEQPPSIRMESEETLLNSLSDDQSIENLKSPQAEKVQDEEEFDDLPLTFSGKEGIAVFLNNAKSIKQEISA